MHNIVAQRCLITGQVRLVLSDLVMPGGRLGTGELVPDEVVRLTPYAVGCGPWANLMVCPVEGYFLTGLCDGLKLMPAESADRVVDPNQTDIPLEAEKGVDHGNS